MEIDNGYYIDSWHYQATVHADNSWDVTETLTVTYLEPRHGIYHYLNTYYQDQHPWEEQASVNYSYSICVDDIQVEDYTFEVMDESDYFESKNIVIGDADVTVTGQHTYVISYKLQYHDDRCEEYDQLFHSVLAGNVTTGIGHFDFDLQFDKELPQTLQQPGALNIHGASYGFEKSTLDVQCQVTDHSISGSSDSIPAYHAITLYSRLPEGYYESPLAESPQSYHLFFGLSLALLLYLLYDLVFCHHAQKAVPVVSFYPPKGMTSAEVGTIIDQSADTSDLISLLPWLAQQGYIRITEIPDTKGRTGKYGHLQLDLLRTPGKDLPQYIYLFMEALFGKNLKNRQVMTNKFDDKCGEKVEKAKEQLQKSFTGERALTTSSGRKQMFIFLAFLLGAITLSLTSQVDTFRIEEVLMGLFYFSASAFMWGYVSADESKRHLHSSIHNLVRMLLVLLVYALTFGLCYLMWEPQDSFLTLDMLAVLMGLSCLVALYSGRLIRDTDYRLQTMGQLLGLREFIRVAELPKLKMLVDEDPAYFYKVLPYAMAFGLSDKWVKHFANIDIQQPDWYDTSSTALAASAFSGAALANSFHASMASISSQIAAQSLANSQSSGGSGGGFAGGGGGGGGTGSW